MVLEQLHTQPSSGHLSIRRTLARVHSRFYWVGCKGEILAWCKTCEVCQRRKSPYKSHRGPMKQYNVGAPMEQVALDIMGPFPESYHGKRNTILVIPIILPVG